MSESDRCWPGYEPVKGKKPHEQGSCKPEAKPTASGKKFQTKRKAQLTEWQKEHPNTSKSAAQHLHAPSKKTKVNKSSNSTKESASNKKRSSPAKTSS